MSTDQKTGDPTQSKEQKPNTAATESGRDYVMVDRSGGCITSTEPAKPVASATESVTTQTPDEKKPVVVGDAAGASSAEQKADLKKPDASVVQLTAGFIPNWKRGPMKTWESADVAEWICSFGGAYERIAQRCATYRVTGFVLVGMGYDDCVDLCRGADLSHLMGRVLLTHRDELKSAEWQAGLK